MQEKPKGGVGRVVIVLSIIVMAAAAVIFAVNMSSFEKERDKLQKQIDALRQDITDTGAASQTVASSDEGETEGEYVSVVERMMTAGETMADLQNRYYDEVIAGNWTDADAQVATLEIGDEISEELDTYLGSGSNYRVSWYYGNPVFGRKWFFSAPSQIDKNMIPALWTCRGGENGDGDVLAYVTGYYNCLTGYFENMRTYLTPAGSDDAGSLADEKVQETEYADYILGLVDKVMEGETEPETMSAEEIEAQREAVVGRMHDMYGTQDTPGETG